MQKYLKPTLLAAALIFVAPAAQAITISTGTTTTSNIFDFGFPDTLTYGQVFTAPVTGTLDSFTLYLNDAIGGSLFGGVGAWNGTQSYGEGFGISALLYTSPTVATSAGFTSYTFSPAISVTSGQRYVAFLSAFGTDASTTTTMPLADDDSQVGIEYFVWNNSSGPDNPSWNYYFDAGDALFKAEFSSTVSPVPVPAALPLLVTGIAGIGGLAARRKRAAKSDSIQA